MALALRGVVRLGRAVGCARWMHQQVRVLVVPSAGAAVGGKLIATASLRKVVPHEWLAGIIGGSALVSHRRTHPGTRRAARCGAHGQRVGVRKWVHAARRYSCRRPPSRSRRWTRAGGWPLMRVTVAAGIRRLKLQRPVEAMSVVVRE